MERHLRVAVEKRFTHHEFIKKTTIKLIEIESFLKYKPESKEMASCVVFKFPTYFPK